MKGIKELKKLKSALRRIFQKEKIQDSKLDAITCIRYTMTWRCNFKCVSCNIWKNKTLPKEELTSDDIDKLTNNKLLKDVNEVILSGGEPILRNDFPEIVTALHKKLKKAKFSITTNGYDPDRTYNFFKKIKSLAPNLKWALIGVSLNGPKKIHDKSRGINGSFENTVRTAELLKEFSSNVDFSFTFLRDNVEYFDWVQDFAKSKGLGVHICWTVMNDRFSTTEEDLVFQNNSELIPILERYTGIDKIKFTKDVHGDFLKYRGNIKSCYLYNSIINKRIMPCHACKTFFHLAPNGDVYPCNFKLSEDRKMGNVKKENFDKIWENIPQKLFEDIKKGKCMYPNGVCGDSDINRSINQVDTPIFEWYLEKRKKDKKLIQKES